MKEKLIILGAVALALLLAPTASHAGFAMGAAQTFIHATDTHAVILRYDDEDYHYGGQAMAWEGSKGSSGAVAADYNLLRSNRLGLNLGLAYIMDKTSINGTNLNFSIRGAVSITRHWEVHASHFSNGQRILGWENGKPNIGWNFLGVLYRF